MKKARQGLLLTHKLIWALFGAHYIILFAVISSEWFDVRDNDFTGILPLNLSVNTISLALAAAGVLALQHTARHHARVWRRMEVAIYGMMLFWILSVSLWLVAIARL